MLQAYSLRGQYRSLFKYNLYLWNFALQEPGKELNVKEKLEKLSTRFARTSPPSFKKWSKGLTRHVAKVSKET